MKIPAAALGALAGAAVTSIIWIAISPPRANRASPHPSAPTPPSTTQHSPRPASAIGSTKTDPVKTEARYHNTPLTNQTRSDWTRPTLTRPLSVAIHDQNQTRPEPTKTELAVRAKQVENHANNRLEALAIRLNLTEEQQNRIFPILASAAPSFHPALQVEGSSTPTTSSDNSTTLQPGAPITEVENAIYAEVDDTQQASIEDSAIDRDAWWEDIVAMLEDDLEAATSNPTAGTTVESTTTPSSEATGEERAAAATTNQIDDFSNLFGN